MDFNWEIIDKVGVPILTAGAFGFFIWKQARWMQEEMMREMRESFTRLESIVIKLIDQSKESQLELRGLKASYESLIKLLKVLKNGRK